MQVTSSSATKRKIFSFKREGQKKTDCETLRRNLNCIQSPSPSSPFLQDKQAGKIISETDHWGVMTADSKVHVMEKNQFLGQRAEQRTVTPKGRSARNKLIVRMEDENPLDPQFGNQSLRLLYSLRKSTEHIWQ